MVQPVYSLWHNFLITGPILNPQLAKCSGKRVLSGQNLNFFFSKTVKITAAESVNRKIKKCWPKGKKYVCLFKCQFVFLLPEYLLNRLFYSIICCFRIITYTKCHDKGRNIITSAAEFSWNQKWWKAGLWLKYMSVHVPLQCEKMYNPEDTYGCSIWR